jgi:hypothetical protein
MATYRRVWIDSATVLVNEETGALLVDAAIAAEVGLPVAVNPAGRTTGTGASQTLLVANAARKAAVITNLSLTAILWVALGPTALSGSGIPLAPASDAAHPGGALVVDGRNYVGAISGITTDTTANNIAIAEI